MTVSLNQYSSLPELIELGEEGLKGVFEEITNGILVTNEHSQIIYVNRAFTSITGYEAHEVIGDNPGMFHSGRHDKPYYKNMWDTLNQCGRWQGEIWNRRKSGTIVPELLTITKIVNSKQHVFYIGIFSDISFLVQENEMKVNLALRDPLTGLCNRTLFEDRFHVVQNEYKRHSAEVRFKNKQVALLFIDLNRFKQINDSYGHLVGDSVLVFVAQTLKKCARSMDTVARIGGDEFAVILSDITKNEHVEGYCERVHQELSIGTLNNEVLLIPELSIGVSLFPTEAIDFDKLIAYADKAMYHSKKLGSYLTFYSDLAKKTGCI
ncbi:GGDEF domain-containing protein [Legionella quateirensis]|uniref:Sensory box (GGDEF/EAL domain) regulatory protein n=1 Tax=Legionella quateirensis TaxID=45072 RepID=A0A378KSD6_9GAMM|nr:GGDEF domain-containing protein [Legionella quateirensis]KTD51289.1 sensory box (GGDEF/EAL domain) regulatory protein [Legionella quateirensis]STY17465.1 sensory box (GGDEF/EAL domain) regulatory protein [Legionella quateirensis]